MTTRRTVLQRFAGMLGLVMPVMAKGAAESAGRPAPPPETMADLLADRTNPASFGRFNRALAITGPVSEDRDEDRVVRWCSPDGCRIFCYSIARVAPWGNPGHDPRDYFEATQMAAIARDARTVPVPDGV